MSGLFAADALPESAIAASSPVGLGRMMSGGAKVLRQMSDYYPTPAPVTRALIAVEGARIARALLPGEAVWEPCGRGGAIVRVLRDAGFEAHATDLIADPANGVAHANLLAVRHAPSRVVVTNPPFALADEMIRHLLGELRVSYLALLLKATFWHAAGRTGLWRRYPPAGVHALNWRPDFLGGGAPTMDVIWTVWDGDTAEGETRYSVMGPAPAGAVLL